MLEAKKELREVIDRLSKKYDAMEGKVNSQKQKCDQLEKDYLHSREIANLQQELSMLRRESHESFAQIKVDLKNAQKEVSDSKKEVAFMTAEAKNLKAERKQNIRKMVDLEARSRRNNLIFYGIPETEEENCEDKLIQFLKEKLKVEISPTAVQRAHRLGKPRSRNNIGNLAFTPRPMIVLFSDFKQKEMIRKQRFELQRPFGISEDLPIEIRRARKSLENVIKDLKSQGKKVAIIYPCRLLINGQIDKTTHVDIAEFSNVE